MVMEKVAFISFAVATTAVLQYIAKMDWRKTNFALDYLASTGTVFSVEQRLTMQTALTILQQENRFQQLHFLGKILGTESDYWIVCGITKDLLKDRQYFYSKNLGIEWIKLSEVSADVIELGLSCRGHFTGDPTADCETEVCPNTADEVSEADGWVTIKEEERLAATVMSIMNECSVVPRGSLMKDPNGLVFENKMFEGLSKEEAQHLHSYYHFRRPENPWDKNIVGRSDYNVNLDFLDSIAFDMPSGCWSIKMDRLETIATINSLYWPGFFGFHQLGTQTYGWIYVGTGKKNWDVPFMMVPVPNSAKNDGMGGGDFQDMKPGEVEVDLVDVAE